jgi:hypothetical protein
MSKKSLIIMALAVLAIIGIVFLKVSESKTKSFYSGDAIEYNGQLIVATANTGYLELYKFQNSQLVNVVKQAAPVDAQVGSSAYNDALFNIENGRLYVYAASGSTLYKYDFSDLASLPLVNSVRDNTWDWLGHLDKLNGQIVTAGSKSVKLWNQDLQVVDSFAVNNPTNPYNIRLSSDNRFIFNLNGSDLQVFDRGLRQPTRDLTLTTYLAAGNKQVYFDSATGVLFALDDARLTKMNLDGDIYKTLKHDSKFGYDVAPSSDGNYIYISNGTSVAKLNKKDLTFAAGFENRDLHIANSWAMGLKLVPTARGEVLVVFNNSNILVLDKNLKPLVMTLATEADTGSQTYQNLSLKANTNHGIIGSQVMISGSGFGVNEPVNLMFAGMVYQAQADANGSFSTTIMVPASAANLNGADIKAVGQNSQLSYSLGFFIDK